MRIFYLLIIAFYWQSSWAMPLTNHHGHGSNYDLSNALRTGTDTNGQPLYLCQANLFNSVQPGKTWNGYGRCNVPYGGKEYIVDDFEVPARQLFNRASWQRNIRSAVPVGRDTNGSPLFLCQVYFKGSKQPGKTWPGYNNCNISYGGLEIIQRNFQVLGVNRPGVVVTHPGASVTHHR